MNQNARYPKQTQSSIRTNGQVRHNQVRLLDENRALIGIMSSRDAYIKATEKGMDLIELAENANPPVCFIGQASKYIYEMTKKEKEKKKNNKVIQMKEIQLRPNIAEHDALRKLGDADKFLAQGHRVRIVMQFRGREKARIDELAVRMTQMVTEHVVHGKIEGTPSKTDGRYIVTLVASPVEKKSTEETITQPVAEPTV